MEKIHRSLRTYAPSQRTRYNVIVETWLIYKPQIRGDPEFSTSASSEPRNSHVRPIVPDTKYFFFLLFFPRIRSPRARALLLHISQQWETETAPTCRSKCSKSSKCRHDGKVSKPPIIFVIQVFNDRGFCMSFYEYIYIYIYTRNGQFGWSLDLTRSLEYMNKNERIIRPRLHHHIRVSKVHRGMSNLVEARF